MKSWGHEDLKKWPKKSKRSKKKNCWKHDFLFKAAFTDLFCPLGGSEETTCKPNLTPCQLIKMANMSANTCLLSARQVWTGDVRQRPLVSSCRCERVIKEVDLELRIFSNRIKVCLTFDSGLRLSERPWCSVLSWQQVSASYIYMYIFTEYICTHTFW